MDTFHEAKMTRPLDTGKCRKCEGTIIEEVFANPQDPSGPGESFLADYCDDCERLVEDYFA